MMILTNGRSRLEINLAQWDGDAYLTIKVDSMGFSGENDLHVRGEEFKHFCRDILVLQKTLKGKAEINSVFPGELNIVIKPFGGAGYISVSGKFGYNIQTARTENWHSVEFGFEITPQVLDKIAKVEWLKEYAVQ